MLDSEERRFGAHVHTLSSLVGALRGQSEGWHQAMADVEMLKDLIEETQRNNQID